MKSSFYFATKDGIIQDDKEEDRVSFIKSYSKMIKPYCVPCQISDILIFTGRLSELGVLREVDIKG